jgi:hypothetical protein
MRHDVFHDLGVRPHGAHVDLARGRGRDERPEAVVFVGRPLDTAGHVIASVDSVRR